MLMLPAPRTESPKTETLSITDVKIRRIPSRGIDPTRKSNRSLAIFLLLWLLIIAISATDSYLSFKYSDFLYEMELNPVGRWLIELDGGDVALFAGVKLFGTWLAFVMASFLFFKKTSWGLLASLGVACFQGGLLCYLTMG